MIRMTVAAFKKLEARGAARKDRRKDNARFIAKMAGKALALTWKALAGQLDDLWSIIVRRRAIRDQYGLCMICGKRRDLVAYHFLPRGSYAVRWDLDNGCGACAPCNNGERLHRLMYRHKHILIIGAERYAALEAKSRTLANFSRADLKAKRDEFKRMIQTGDY